MTENININFSNILLIFENESKYEKLKLKYISEKKNIDLITSIDNYKLEYNNILKKIKVEDEKIINNIEKSMQKSKDNIQLYKSETNKIKKELVSLNNQKLCYENISNNYDLLINKYNLTSNISNFYDLIFINKKKLCKSEFFIVENFYKLIDKYDINIFKKNKLLPFLSIKNINKLKIELKLKQKNILDIKIKLNKVKNQIEKKYKFKIDEIKVKLVNLKNNIINTRNELKIIGTDVNNIYNKEDGNNYSNNICFLNNMIINPQSLFFLKYSNLDTKEIFILIKEFKKECRNYNLVIEEKNKRLKNILDEIKLIDSKLEQNNISNYKSNKKIYFVLKNELSFIIFFNKINKKFIKDKIKNIKMISGELEIIDDLEKKEIENINLLDEKKKYFDKGNINWKINNYKIYEYYYNDIEKIKKNIFKKYKKIIN